LPQSEKLSLYREIRTHGYEASVIASYNVNFPFYERVVLPQLQASGCRHNILLVDARQCAEQIASDGDGPRLCGSEYTLLPIRSAAAFHPKFVMLLGRRGAKVAVGSHNMTIAGFGLNREIGTVYEVGGDESGAPARQIWRFIQEWTAEFPDAIQHLIFSSEHISPWLHSEDEVDSEILISSATGPNLWETLRPRLPKQVSRLSVIAPYFDSNLDFLKRLDRELHPKELIVAIHPRFSEIRPDAKRVLARVRFVDVSMMRGDWSEKLLHAKLYCFEGVRGQTVVVTGSANASSPAWLNSAGRQNAEIIVVHEDGAQLWSQLGLKALHALPEVTSEAWNVVRDRSAERAKSEDLHHPVPFLAVTTEEGFLVDAEFSQGAATKDVWVINEDGKTAVDEITTRKDQSLFICRDSRVRTSATRIEVRRGKKAARVAIVHHTDALLDKAAGNARQAFRRALSGLDGNPEELASVFAFVEKALFDSPINVDQAGAGGRRNSPPQDTPDLDREIGSMMISARDTVRARRRRRVEATSDLALLIDVLVYKLGIGLRRDSDTAASVRSEEELVLSEDAPEPTIDGSALARLCRGKVNRLFKRMEGQLELAVQRKKNVTAQIFQIEAVLGIVRYLRNREQDFEWLPKGEELVEVEREWGFFESAASCLYGMTNRLAALALEENGGDFAELTVVRGLLTWLALDCGFDTRSVLTALSEEPEDVRADLESVGYFLPVLMDCVADGMATDFLIETVDPKAGDVGANASLRGAATFHLDWARRLARGLTQPAVTPAHFRAGDIVYPLLKKGTSLGVVVEVQGMKAGILDLDTGVPRQFISSYLGKLGEVGSS